MTKVKLLKIKHSYDSFSETEKREIIEGLPWTEVDDKTLEILREFVINKYKLSAKKYHNFSFILVEEVVEKTEDLNDLSLEIVIADYLEVTEKEREQKRKREEALAKKKALEEEKALAKKQALYKKLKEEFGETS